MMLQGMIANADEISVRFLQYIALIINNSRKQKDSIPLETSSSSMLF